MPTAVDSMSIWALVEDASVLVQIVMLILVAASLASWFVIVQRSRLLASARRSLQRFEAQFRAEGNLDRLFAQPTEQRNPAEQVCRVGFSEYQQLSQHATTESAAVMEGTQRAMMIAIAREEKRLEKNLPFLATVGSVSPYIGLFGTVWGIMNSFIGLSQAQQATLAAVAPGIAEALIATAIGLFAAIPAVIAYNRFTAGSEDIIAGYYTVADELATQLHRRLHTPGQR
ncbi:protein TolQ [Ectothiorhodospira lacustris]|uniref:protein TolQ n=1 Tax=Ectothiorhodospira lacustris TaxID=2899127 RepID=UPI001EE8AE96|nr:protein TolQ [Ectothiorhodospira lacustris]MCG5511134.1 protein TolQ [Ectothiorhodospira lacustris]MCG5522798.1 protein TolQ [Ectothiorhodospira lacustris]